MRTVLAPVVAVGLFVAFVPNEALANGRRTPQTVETAPPTAVCRLRASGHEATLFRARVTDGDEHGDALLVRRAGQIEKLPIRDIRSLEIESTRADAGGFAKAILAGADSAEQSSVEVQVRKNNKVVRLQGFTEGGQQTTVALDDCKTLRIEVSKRRDDVDGAVPAD